MKDNIHPELNSEDLVGESAALKRVLRQARTVALCDATVLILGKRVRVRNSSLVPSTA